MFSRLASLNKRLHSTRLLVGRGNSKREHQVPTTLHQVSAFLSFFEAVQLFSFTFKRCPKDTPWLEWVHLVLREFSLRARIASQSKNSLLFIVRKQHLDAYLYDHGQLHTLTLQHDEHHPIPHRQRALRAHFYEWQSPVLVIFFGTHGVPLVP